VRALRLSITTYSRKEEGGTTQWEKNPAYYSSHDGGTTHWDNKTPHQCGGHNVMVVFVYHRQRKSITTGDILVLIQFN